MVEQSRDDLASLYFDQLTYDLYPVQEEALLAWFTSEQGVLVCAPTGTGKTLIAEAALFEALHKGQSAYYTTPLIALTDQKFQEMQEAAVRWGFSADDVGLVTGNRRVNPDAPILVVVAEILLNRLLHPQAFDLDRLSAVVMDEFHSFNDPERGVVWEFTLGLLPAHVRLLLLSATVGNAYEFTRWLGRNHRHKVELVEGDERKVPLSYHWVGDQLLNEHIEGIAQGGEENRRTPALVFCFNREECWNIAEQLKGKKLMAAGQQSELSHELERFDWSLGVGPKLRQLLMRGVGVHHAGLLPRYRRIVEEMFQRKLLSVAVCTETLSAGINLPARSVVLPCLLKGPPNDKRIIGASSAHQIFGRAGRPQFDTEGFVYALAHEDDVRLMRWREKYDQIPEDTKDPQLRKAKKQLKKKMPKRRTTETYWQESQFVKLCGASPARLSSRGALPCRLLAYILNADPDVEKLRQLVGKRLIVEAKRLERAQKDLDQLLLTLWSAGYVELDPAPPPATEEQATPQSEYQPKWARPTGELEKLLLLRSVHPLYGVYLINQLGAADHSERIQAMESVLEIPGSVGRRLRVPDMDELPPGPLATERLDPQLLQFGLASVEQLVGKSEDEEEERGPRGAWDEDPLPRLTLAEKLRMLFHHQFPGVHDLRVYSVWSAGELLEFGGDFDKYIRTKRLQKQEGIVFRHLLRLILLAGEFAQFSPPDMDSAEWKSEMDAIAQRLTMSCRAVDPDSTDRSIEDAAISAELAREDLKILR